MSKYHNKKCYVDGIAFDSKKEAQRYAELSLLEKIGVIRNLKLQKEFELIPACYEQIPKKRGNGFKKGKCIERAVNYRADFYYYDNDKQEWVCEDVKGMRTKEYIIKRKLMLWVHDIRIVEI